METQICTVESIAAEWDRLADETRAGPFLRPGWTLAWWRAFGQGSLRTLAVRTGDRLTGIVPLVWDGRTVRSPTNAETTVFGFLFEGDESARRLASAVLSAAPARLDLSALRSDDPAVRYLIDEARDRNFLTVTERASQAPYLRTVEDWGAYESSLEAKFRSEIRRRRRRLGEQGDLLLELIESVDDGRLETLLAEGFEVERSGWKGEYGTAIDSDPRTRRFYVDVARWANERGWLVLAFLRLGGRAIAFDLCLEADGVHYLLKTGFDHDFHRFAPGVLIRSMMLERAFTGPIETYEFLGTVEGAANRWKLDWTDRCHDHLRIVAFPPSVASTVRSLTMRYGAPLRARARASVGKALGPSGRHLVKRGRAFLRRLTRS